MPCRAWSRSLVEIGAADAAGDLPLLHTNRLLTELAVASIDAAMRCPARIGRRYEKLAMNRVWRCWASAGWERRDGYGSDLDVVLVYDSAAPHR